MGGYMDGYSIAHLEELLNEIGEERVKSILSNFSCPRNRDIEFFLRDKAIEFSKQSIAKTYLVFTSYKQEAVLAGYFTVANKQMQVSKDDLSKNIIRKIARFGRRNIDEDELNSGRYLIQLLRIDNTKYHNNPRLA